MRSRTFDFISTLLGVGAAITSASKPTTFAKYFALAKWKSFEIIVMSFTHSVNNYLEYNKFSYVEVEFSSNKILKGSIPPSIKYFAITEASVAGSSCPCPPETIT